MVFALFFLFFAATFLSFFYFRDTRIKSGLYFFLGLLLILLAVGKDGTGLPDYQGFVDNMEGGVETSLDIKEPAFFAIRNLGDRFPEYRILLGLVFYAVFGITAKLIAIRQLTEFWFIALAAYISNYYMLHDLIQIRAGVASGFLLLCIKPLYERNGKLFLFLATVAFLFHYSAIVIFPLWFLDPKKLNKVLFASIIPAGYLFYFIGINITTVASLIPIPIIQTKLIIYQQLIETGPEWASAYDPFSIFFMIQIFMFYLMFYKADSLQFHNKYTYLLLKIYSIALASLLWLGDIPTVAYRTKELLAVVEIVLYPSLVYMATPRSMSKMLPLTFCLFVLILLVFNARLLSVKV